MSDFVVVDIETTGNEPWRHELVAVGIGKNVFQPAQGRAMVRMLLQRQVTIVCHTNYDLRWLMLDGAELGEMVTYHDTKVMAWMLDGTQPLDLESLAVHYLGYRPPKLIRKRAGVIEFLCADGEHRPIEQAPWEEVAAYCQSDCDTEGELYLYLRARLQEEGLWEHFVAEEAPFSRLLVEMEVAGLPYDREAGARMLDRLETEAEVLREGLVKATGAPGFNPGSGDQVAAFLYEEVWEHPFRFEIPRLNGKPKDEKLEIVQRLAPKGARVTKVGRDYAYAELVLDGRGLKPPKVKRRQDEPAPKRPTVSGKLLNVLYGDDAWVGDYVQWKKVEKLAGYLRDWQEREHDGRLHGRFDQSGTVTGRLAGREPNLQQVSSTGDVRGLFVGDLVVGDYAGLEARLAAHFSGDPLMLQVFREGKDLYGVLAAQAWGGPPTKQNEGRGLMKVVWLASQYGAQGETLATTMAVAGMRGYTARKADALLADMKATVPQLFAWRERVIAEAKYNGYVTTLGGRKRHLAGLDSAEWKVMARAERQAVNSLVQGSAADVVRRAMLAARRGVAPEIARILLQVHDELVWERMGWWEDGVLERLGDICDREHGFDLDVPLKFEITVAQSWADKGGSPGQAAAGAYEHLNEVAA